LNSFVVVNFDSGSRKERLEKTSRIWFAEVLVGVVTSVVVVEEAS